MNNFDAVLIAPQLTQAETAVLKIALTVLRDRGDNADFLQWWLSEYGCRKASFQTEEPIVGSSQPTSVADLDALEQELDRWLCVTASVGSRSIQ